MAAGSVAGGSAVVRFTHADGTTAEVTGDVVLAALGRSPVLPDGLDAAGVAVERGAVVVNEFLRTTAEHVYAIGDCHGGPQFTYISLDDHRVMLDQITGAPNPRATTRRTAVASCIFTSPPIARVGATEAEARATGRPLKIAVRQIAEIPTIPRARITGDPRGFIKAIVDAETDRILGLTLMSVDAHEVINTAALAMRAGLTASQMRDEIYTHPSMTEIFNDVFAKLQPA
jgi:pyruvate/2-oxoglutarate dehydrogenase complex dihydrolipoamide dehydrogenase (E3) component